MLDGPMAIISLITVVFLIVLSSFTKINIGIFAIALSLIFGSYYGHEDLSKVIGLFPTELFLTLVAVTFLFSQAQVNGTLGRLTSRIVSGMKGNVALIPIAFFFLAFFLSAIGVGNIAATAIIAPTAMLLAHRIGIPSFLMVLMVANGANAGCLSPLAPTGIIASTRMKEVGITGLEWTVFQNSLIAHVLIAIGGYLLFGGYQLWKKSPNKSEKLSEQTPSAFLLPHRVTLGVIFLLIIGTSFFHMHIAIGAFVGSLVLTLLRTGNDEDAMAKIPWNIILMVCGMSMLASLMDQAGGLDLVTNFITQFSNQHTVIGYIALAAALISVYSSSSAVVLPTFLLMIPKIVSNIPNASPAALAASIAIASHLVDVSPLSSIGAICISSTPATENRQSLFNKMLIWGLSMSIVGALVCYFLFGVFLKA